MVAGPSQLQHLERIAVPTTRHKLDSCKAFFDNTCTTFRKRSCSCVRRQQAHRGPIDQYNTRDVALEAPVQQQWGYTTSSCRANLSFRLRRVRQTSTFIQTKTDYPQASALPFPPASSPRSSSPTSVPSSHGSTSPLFSAVSPLVSLTSAIRLERLALASSHWSL